MTYTGDWVDLRYKPVSDQTQRDDAAFALITKGVDIWSDAEALNKYPFDNEDYSVIFENREFQNLQLMGWQFEGNARNSLFIDCYFEGCDFSGTNFEGCKFKTVVATDTVFVEAIFDNAQAQTCSFEGCNFEDISWLDGNIEQVNFRYSHFTEAVFDGSRFNEVTFHGSHGRLTSFDGVRMFEISWLGARFTESSFKHTYIPRQPIYMGETSFVSKPDGEEDEEDEFEIAGCNFTNSRFQDAHLQDLDFAVSNLTKTAFFWCDLSGANLRRATGVWAGAFRGADLTGAQLPFDISFEIILKKIDSAVSLARPAALTNLVTCAAIILAVVVASDASSVTLPLFGVPVDSGSFALYGLIQSALISLYVSIYLIRICEGTVELPVIHPNGLSTPDLISPWTIIATNWLFLRVISGKKRLIFPGGYVWQFTMAVLSHWLLTPLTAALVAFSFRYESVLEVSLFAGISILSLAINSWLFRLEVKILRSDKT